MLIDKLNKIKSEIHSKQTLSISPNFSQISSDFMWWGMRTFYGINNKKANDFCNGCQTCVKLCPTNNIRYDNNKISFGNNCTYCFACIHWCPERAIRFGRLKINDKTIYTNPTISVKEMITRNKNK